MKKLLLVVGIVGLTIVPAGTALADFTVGGGSGTVGPCDVYFPSATFYDNGRPKSFNAGHVDC